MMTEGADFSHSFNFPVCISSAFKSLRDAELGLSLIPIKFNPYRCRDLQFKLPNPNTILELQDLICSLLHLKGTTTFSCMPAQPWLYFASPHALPSPRPMAFSCLQLPLSLVIVNHPVPGYILAHYLLFLSNPHLNNMLCSSSLIFQLKPNY